MVELNTLHFTWSLIVNQAYIPIQYRLFLFSTWFHSSPQLLVERRCLNDVESIKCKSKTYPIDIVSPIYFCHRDEREEEYYIEPHVL